MADLVTKAATDIKVFNGSAWISVKTNKVMLHNGTSFVNANNPKILINGSDYWYFIQSVGTFTVFPTSVWFSSDEFPETLDYQVSPYNSVVSVKSKPNYMNVSIGVDTISISIKLFSNLRQGTLVLQCDNGAPDIAINVIEDNQM